MNLTLIARLINFFLDAYDPLFVLEKLRRPSIHFGAWGAPCAEGRSFVFC